MGPKWRTERPRKTKIGTEVAHVTRDSDTTFKVKRSKVNLQGRGHIVAASRTACCNREVHLFVSNNNTDHRHSLLKCVLGGHYTAVSVVKHRESRQAI